MTKLPPAPSRQRRAWWQPRIRNTLRFTIAMTSVLVLLTSFTLLDTFVIPRMGTVVDESRETVARSFLQAQERATAAAAGAQETAVPSALPADTADAKAAETALATTSARQAAASATPAAVTIKAPQPQQTASSSTAASPSWTAAAETVDTAADSSADSTAASVTSAAPQVTDNAYQDENVSIQITTHTWNGTTYYVADVTLSSAEYLTTAFAGGVYGRNIRDVTSSIASDVNAILAINGDYYGFRDTGYVLRNGVMYRDTPGTGEALVIDVNGNFSVVRESETSLATLMSQGAWQVFSFGPGLVIDGEISVSAGEEVGRSMASNPRTAIGQIGENHYVLVVSDGRTNTSQGFSLLELAQVMKSLGCVTAYNLDGGGSSTMVFMGQVVNQPTTNGHQIKERSVSDIVAIV